MREAVFFEDGKGELGVMTDLRPAFCVRTGACMNMERMCAALGADVRAWRVREEIRGVAEEMAEAIERAGGARVGVNTLDELSGDEAWLVNGRCVLTTVEMGKLSVGEAVVEDGTGEVAVARLSRAEAERFLRGEWVEWRRQWPSGRRVLMNRPWDVKRFRDEALDADLARLKQEQQEAGGTGTVMSGALVIGDERELVLMEGARVMPGAVVDVEAGPVVLGKGATVRPGAIVSGPAYVGDGSTVVERSHIKGHTAIGPRCKMGGEVGGTIVQGLSNKAHDGHLGDTWLGEWVNLGAGTVNSNLLNTYGEVAAKANAQGSTERTGETFFGCVLGDHVKTAIGTRIMTGAVCETGAMWAAAAAMTGYVPRFAWVTDLGRRTYRYEKFMEAARAMMGRRGREPARAYAERIRALMERESAAGASADGGETGKA